MTNRNHKANVTEIILAVLYIEVVKLMIKDPLCFGAADREKHDG